MRYTVLARYPDVDSYALPTLSICPFVKMLYSLELYPYLTSLLF